MSDLRLVIFDVDGTLVDSQGDILTAMQHAFEAIRAPLPSREAVLGIVGLSLDVAMPRLAPDLGTAEHAALVAGYKDAYMRHRVGGDPRQSSPLYPHAAETLRALHARPDILLGVATGKSRRGLRALIDSHDLDGLFVTSQTADDHPSKPHPAMLLAALAETGLSAEHAVMIGDTSYDIDMARAAGIPAIAVAWGYHAPAALHRADALIHDFRDLPESLHMLWKN